MDKEIKPLVQADMVKKELKFRTLASGDTQATLTLEAVFDDQEVLNQMKELATKKYVYVVIVESNG